MKFLHAKVKKKILNEISQQLDQKPSIKALGELTETYATVSRVGTIWLPEQPDED